MSDTGPDNEEVRGRVSIDPHPTKIIKLTPEMREMAEGWKAKNPSKSQETPAPPKSDKPEVRSPLYIESNQPAMMQEGKFNIKEMKEKLAQEAPTRAIQTSQESPKKWWQRIFGQK